MAAVQYSRTVLRTDSVALARVHCKAAGRAVVNLCDRRTRLRALCNVLLCKPRFKPSLSPNHYCPLLQLLCARRVWRSGGRRHHGRPCLQPDPARLTVHPAVVRTCTLHLPLPEALRSGVGRHRTLLPLPFLFIPRTSAHASTANNRRPSRLSALLAPPTPSLVAPHPPHYGPSPIAHLPSAGAVPFSPPCCSPRPPSDGHPRQ